MKLINFAQWRYTNQWSIREVVLLLVENYSQYPGRTMWNTVVRTNFWPLLMEATFIEIIQHTFPFLSSYWKLKYRFLSLPWVVLYIYFSYHFEINSHEYHTFLVGRKFVRHIKSKNCWRRKNVRSKIL